VMHRDSPMILVAFFGLPGFNGHLFADRGWAGNRSLKPNLMDAS